MAMGSAGTAHPAAGPTLGGGYVTNIIVAFSKPEDAKSIKNILTRNGFSVVAVCYSGASALNNADALDGGIVVCGYRFEDMIYQGVYEALPEGFEMLLIASPARVTGALPSDLVFLPMPLKVHDLLHTVDMMAQVIERRRKRKRVEKKARSDEEQQLIDQAKALLMERNSMTEEQAHRYIQKCSMDSGTNMVETAQMVLSLHSV
jgi:response regulator NasT